MTKKINEVTTTPPVIPTAGVNDTPQTKQEKSEQIKAQMLLKFDEDVRPLVEYLLNTFQISLWLSTDKQELSWLQQVGEKFTIIGKTKFSSLSDDVGYFYASYEEMADGNLPLDRFVVEVKVKAEAGTTLLFDVVLSQLKSEFATRTEKWAELGYGDKESMVIEQVKIIDKIPF